MNKQEFNKWLGKSTTLKEWIHNYLMEIVDDYDVKVNLTPNDRKNIITNTLDIREDGAPWDEISDKIYDLTRESFEKYIFNFKKKGVGYTLYFKGKKTPYEIEQRGEFNLYHVYKDDRAIRTGIINLERAKDYCIIDFCNDKKGAI